MMPRNWHRISPADAISAIGVQAARMLIESGSIPEPNSGCWIWEGWAGTGRSEYGRVRVNARPLLAHRLSFAAFNGDLRSEHLVCHRCDNRLCVNPDHLFLGNHTTNALDMVRKGRAGRAKLCADDVSAIRLDRRPARFLAGDYGVSKSAIQDARSRKTWADTP